MQTLLNRDHIADIAEEKLRQFGIHFMPVDLDELARKNGIEIVNAEFYDKDVSGLISKVKPGNITIFVKDSDPYTRKRFTIAHELGHFFLHLGNENGDLVDHAINFYRRLDSTNNGADRMEAEANQFAAALLMPSAAVKRLVEDDLDLTVEQMAKMFAVSPTAMGYRLADLGLR